MKLSKPSDIEEEPSEQMSGEQIDVTEPADVEVKTLAGPVSLPEAVELHAEILEEPEKFGLVSETEVEELREENAEIRERVKELEALTDKLGGWVDHLADDDVYDPTEEFK